MDCSHLHESHTSSACSLGHSRDFTLMNVEGNRCIRMRTLLKETVEIRTRTLLKEMVEIRTRTLLKEMVEIRTRTLLKEMVEIRTRTLLKEMVEIRTRTLWKEMVEIRTRTSMCDYGIDILFFQSSGSYQVSYVEKFSCL